MDSQAIPERTLWQQVRFRYRNEYWAGKKTLQQVRKGSKRGHMVSSLCENGVHMPALDIDFRVEYSKKRRTLTFWSKITKDSFLTLLQTMAFCEIISEHYFHRACNATQSLGLKEHSLVNPWTIYEMPDFVKVKPSTTSGHFHLFIDKPMVWDSYRRLLRVLHEAGIISSDFLELSLKHKQSFLFLPGQKNKIKLLYVEPT